MACRFYAAAGEKWFHHCRHHPTRNRTGTVRPIYNRTISTRIYSFNTEVVTKPELASVAIPEMEN